VVRNRKLKVDTRAKNQKLLQDVNQHFPLKMGNTKHERLASPREKGKRVWVLEFHIGNPRIRRDLKSEVQIKAVENLSEKPAV
jgi:adenylate cyclase